MRTLDINEGNWMGSSAAGLWPCASVTVMAVVKTKKKIDFIILSEA